MTEQTKKYVFPDSKENSGVTADRVRVDKVTLRRGDLEPQELTESQVKRVEESLGIKLQEAGSEKDAAGKLEGAALDAALKDAGVSVAAGTSADDKRKALQEALDDKDN